MNSIHLQLNIHRSAFQLDLSLQLPGQGITAVFGPSGSGKTTFVNLILRFYDLEAGQILIDGQDPNGPCPLPWQLGYIEAIKALGGDITSSTYPNDDHFSLPQSSVEEARTWLNSKF